MTNPGRLQIDLVDEKLGRLSSHPHYADKTARMWLNIGLWITVGVPILLFVIYLLVALEFRGTWFDEVFSRIGPSQQNLIVGILSFSVFVFITATFFTFTALLQNRLASSIGNSYKGYEYISFGSFIFVCVCAWCLILFSGLDDRLLRATVLTIAIAPLPCLIYFLGWKRLDHAVRKKLFVWDLSIIYIPCTTLFITLLIGFFKEKLAGNPFYKILLDFFTQVLKITPKTFNEDVEVLFISAIYLGLAFLILRIVCRFAYKIIRGLPPSETDYLSSSASPYREEILRRIPPPFIVPQKISDSPVFFKFHPTPIATDAVDISQQAQASLIAPLSSVDDPSVPVLDWIRPCIASLDVWKLCETENVNLNIGNVSNSQPIANSNARLFFGGPPTFDQEKALDLFINLGSSSPHGPNPRGNDLLIEGEPGSGRTTLLIAAALEVVFQRRSDVLFIVPDEARTSAAVLEIQKRIVDNGWQGLIFAERLLNDTVSSSLTNARVLPQILVATLDTVEQFLLGATGNKVSANILKGILARRDTILIDDLIEFSAAHRAHLPFVIDKIRLVMKLQQVDLQVAMVTPPLSLNSRLNLTTRLLSNKAEPNLAVLKAPLERFKLIPVRVTAGLNYSQSQLDELSHSLAQRIANVVLEKGCKVAIILRNSTAAACMTIQRSLESKDRHIRVVASVDELRNSREFIASWTLFRKKTQTALAIIAITDNTLGCQPVVISIELDTPPVSLETFQVLPILPSSKSWTFIVRHLLSVARFIHPQLPLHRDSWARLGLNAAGKLDSTLPLLGSKKIQPQLILELDPSETDGFAQSLMDKSDSKFWPWVSRESSDTEIDVPQIVQFQKPPSFEDLVELAASGTSFKIGRIATTPERTNTGSEIKSEAMTSNSHLLTWHDNHGNELGVTDLAYGEQLLLRTPAGTFFPSRIDVHPKTKRNIIQGQPSIGNPGEPCNPIWHASLHIPNVKKPSPADASPDDSCIHKLNGGVLGSSLLRYDIERRQQPQIQSDVLMEERRRRRTLSNNNVISTEIDECTPKLALTLKGALDTAGVTSRITRIEFSHEFRGVAWIILRSGLKDEDVEKAELAAQAGLAGHWTSSAVSKSTVEEPGSTPQLTIEAPWKGDIWPELSAGLQIGLRQSLPGWEYFGRVIAFEPSAAAAKLSVKAVVFFTEPLPTQGTVSDAINSLVWDKELLRSALKQCRLSLESIDDPIKLSIQAGTLWERETKANGISKANQLVAQMLIALENVRGSTSVPWFDQSDDPEYPIVDPFSGDLNSLLTLEEQDKLTKELQDPKNKVWHNWLLETKHTFVKPSPELRPLNFHKWSDNSNCVKDRFGDSPESIPGMQPNNYALPDATRVDYALAIQIEKHFGYPNQLAHTGPFVSTEVLALLQKADRFARSMHGWALSNSNLYIDNSWVIRVSAPALKNIALSILRTYHPKKESSGEKLNPREIVEGLTSYVQNAIPYRLISDLPDDKYRGEYRTPLLTLIQGGDCDSKSMLLAALIRSVCPVLPIALVHIECGEPHAILGVGDISNDSKESHTMIKDKSYVLIESTADRDIGNLSPDCEMDTIEAFPIASLET